jgi:methionyl-tRNA formyltransferase
MPGRWPIVFMGTPGTAAATLELLLKGPDPVVGVVSQPDRPAGRGQRILASPVRRIAENYGIPCAAPEKIRDPGFLRILDSWRPEMIAVVAYGRILPKSILALAPHGCLNVHYSLLPKYRGAAPVAWAIVNGEEKTGVTTMQLVEKMDAGPVYLQQEVSVDPKETTASLQTKLTPIGASLLLETIEGIKNRQLLSRSQDESAATTAPPIRKEDGLVDWTQAAMTIERRVRGFNPWPSAYTYVRGKLLKIHRASVVQSQQKARPGEVVRIDSGGFWVSTGDGLLDLEEVQLENKTRLPGAEFVKGARIKPGEPL